ncbi:hypothetical protein BGX26_002334 [Mortierella sp. AD094]|nr:hypothetical protein BGX26_002334 [Mortierella sp. AD094]
MIIGAGVAGLLHAILLKRANIPFDIFERAQSVKPLVPGKKICWSIQIQLEATTAEDRANKNTEWGPGSNEAMIKEVYDFPTTYGPLGKFINATPREQISKVFLEEKMFETWYHDRVVLIGDASASEAYVSTTKRKLKPLKVRHNGDKRLGGENVQRYHDYVQKYQRKTIPERTKKRMSSGGRILQWILLQAMDMGDENPRRTMKAVIEEAIEGIEVEGGSLILNLNQLHVEC